jgi:hypothetical protein
LGSPKLGKFLSSFLKGIQLHGIRQVDISLSKLIFFFVLKELNIIVEGITAGFTGAFDVFTNGVAEYLVYKIPFLWAFPLRFTHFH